MTVNKGLKSIVDSTPDFSNQALENAINDIKAVDKDDGYLFIKSQFDVDTAIHDNTVLTTSQKNDALATLYAAQPHLQIGRYLNDLIRHTNKIIDGSIIPGDPNILTGEQGQGTFSEILQLVQGLQQTIPTQFGTTASEQNKDVNDHLGILNNMFSETEDSTEPVFTRLKRIITLIRDTATTGGGSSALAIGTAAVRYSNTQLVTFLATLRDDSTDFQTSLDNAVNQAAGNMSSLNTRINDALVGDPEAELTDIRNTIITQETLENSNITALRSYTERLSLNSAYIGLADDPEIRSLMAKVSQNEKWQNYFNEYEQNLSYINPLYGVNQDSDKASVIEQVLANSGLPDVTDPTDLGAVAEKAKRDSRINTANFDKISVEQQIIKSCEQLGITTLNRNTNSLSGTLLRNMNEHDRDEIARQLDLNEEVDTLS